MPVSVSVHSSTRTALIAIGCAVVASLSVIIYKKLSDAPVSVNADQEFVAQGRDISLLDYAYENIIELVVEDEKYERYWTVALASSLNGEAERSIENGRVDVVSERYAIEVDRLDKWHEGLGQAIHYGLATNKIPSLALFVESENWPLSAKAKSVINTVEIASLKSGVKLVILKPKIADL